MKPKFAINLTESPQTLFAPFVRRQSPTVYGVRFAIYTKPPFAVFEMSLQKIHSGDGEKSAKRDN
jgi:hypothetical protein